MKLLALTLSLILLVQGCMPSADGANVNMKALKAANKKAAGGGKKKGRKIQSAAGNRGAEDTTAKIPFVRKTGYVIRGTDVMMFHPCGDTTSYFVVAGGAAMQRIAQRYKFSVGHPYVPMYIDLQLRFLHDTVSSGDYVFTRVADVKDVYQEAGKPKECLPPSRAAMVAASKGR
jgi:hypothetical protein